MYEDVHVCAYVLTTSCCEASFNKHQQEIEAANLRRAAAWVGVSVWEPKERRRVEGRTPEAGDHIWWVCQRWLDNKQEAE